MVGFLDGTARKYTADFSSYTNFYVPEVVDYFRTRRIDSAFVRLSNSTTITFSSKMTLITTANFKTMRDYNYVTYVEESNVALN